MKRILLSLILLVLVIGIVSWGTDNDVSNNKVRGFDEPYYGVEGGMNKVIPGPNGPANAFW